MQAAAEQTGRAPLPPTASQRRVPGRHPRPHLCACADGMPGSAFRSDGRASLMASFRICGGRREFAEKNERCTLSCRRVNNGQVMTRPCSAGAVP